MEKITRNDQIVEVQITNAMRNAISAATTNMGVLNSRTLVGGEGNRSGVAGELIVASYLPTLNHIMGNHDYDFADPATGFKIDVKTKGNSFRPMIDYDCTIPAYQRFQDCDIYVFTRISKDESRGWINGWITKKDFEIQHKTRHAGSRYNNAGRASVGSHKVVLINQLYPMDKLKTFLLNKHNEMLQMDTKKEFDSHATL